MESVNVEPRRSDHERCAICHDTFGESERVVCGGCQTISHRSCRASLARCPTLGCKVATPSQEAPPRPTLDQAWQPPPRQERRPSWDRLIRFATFDVCVLILMSSAAENASGALSEWLKLLTLALALGHAFVLPIWVAARTRGNSGALWALLAQFAFVCAMCAFGTVLQKATAVLWLAAWALEPILVAALAKALARESPGETRA